MKHIRVNWKRFALTFCLLQLVLMTASCTAAWLGAVSALLPALAAARRLYTR